MRFVREISWGTKPLRQPWHSIALSVLGLILLVVAARSYLNTARFIGEATRVPGNVVEVVSTANGYQPVVSYIDPNGASHRFTSDIASRPPRYRVGEPVIVIYLPGDPASARIYGFWELWITAQVTSTLGIAFSLGAIFLWVYRRKLF